MFDGFENRYLDKDFKCGVYDDDGGRERGRNYMYGHRTGGYCAA